MLVKPRLVLLHTLAVIGVHPCTPLRGIQNVWYHSWHVDGRDLFAPHESEPDMIGGLKFL